MTGFGRVEGFHKPNFGSRRVTRFPELGKQGKRRLFLFQRSAEGRVDKYSRPVLSTFGPAVNGEIVEGEKLREQGTGRELTQIVNHPNNFGVAGGFGADLFICRSLRVPAGKSGSGSQYAGYLPQVMLPPPEASTG